MPRQINNEHHSLLESHSKDWSRKQTRDSKRQVRTHSKMCCPMHSSTKQSRLQCKHTSTRTPNRLIRELQSLHCDCITAQ